MNPCTITRQATLSMGVSDKNTGVGCRSLPLLQGIFPTQGSNPGLLHCRQNNVLVNLHQNKCYSLFWQERVRTQGSTFALQGPGPGYEEGVPCRSVNLLRAFIQHLTWDPPSVQAQLVTQTSAGGALQVESLDSAWPSSLREPGTRDPASPQAFHLSWRESSA